MKKTHSFTTSTITATVSLTALILLASCASTKKLYPTAEEPFEKDHFQWEQTVVPGVCKFRGRDAEIQGVTKTQTWIRIEIENNGNAPLSIDPAKLILRSTLLKDPLQPIAAEKLAASVKSRVEGTEKMLNETTWEGVKEIDEALGKDKDSAEVREAAASHDKRVRERVSASDEKTRLENLVPVIETQLLKTTSVEPGGVASGIVVYDTDFERKGTASLDSTSDPCKGTLNFSVKP